MLSARPSPVGQVQQLHRPALGFVAAPIVAGRCLHVRVPSQAGHSGDVCTGT